MSPPLPAIEIHDVVKRFKKRSTRAEYSTLKSELVRLFRGERDDGPPQYIDVLKGLDLTVPKGSTVGIIGRNGSGKSTLLKLLTGIYTPTAGSITVRGRVSALLELGAGFHPDFTGRENILINGIILGMTRDEVKARVADIVAFAELGDFIDEPVRTYSNGMFMRLAFAVATHVDPDILIVDEILSVGDEHFSKKSHAKMTEFKNAGRTIVLVTHALDTVERWCDLAVWVDGGRTRLVGAPRAVVAEYRRAVQAAEAQNEKTGHSALSAPGLALPSLTSELTTPPVRATAVTLLDEAGLPLAAPTAERAAVVSVDFDVAEPGPLACTVDVLTSDGRLAFSTTGQLGVVARGAGRVRATFPRLGLGAGSWVVSATCHRPGVASAAPVTLPILVTAHEGAGLFRPVHTWALDGATKTPVTDAAVPRAHA